jgi:hypothetical protein
MAETIRPVVLTTANTEEVARLEALREQVRTWRERIERKLWELHVGRFFKDKSEHES